MSIGCSIIKSQRLRETGVIVFLYVKFSDFSKKKFHSIVIVFTYSLVCSFHSLLSLYTNATHCKFTEKNIIRVSSDVSTNLSVNLYVNLSACLSVYHTCCCILALLSISSHMNIIRESMNVYICISVYLSNFISVYLYICLSVCITIKHTCCCILALLSISSHMNIISVEHIDGSFRTELTVPVSRGVFPSPSTKNRYEIINNIQRFSSIATKTIEPFS